MTGVDAHVHVIHDVSNGLNDPVNKILNFVSSDHTTESMFLKERVWFPDGLPETYQSKRIDKMITWDYYSSLSFIYIYSYLFIFMMYLSIYFLNTMNKFGL